jgi:putative spermidine/putrescine transport system permease protein
MQLSATARRIVSTWAWLGYAFLYLPLIVIFVLSFNSANSLTWPPKSLTTKWWSKAFDNQGVRDALVESLRIALFATVIALVLGTMLSFAVHRFRFFGRQALSFLVVLPIALPGIVTGIALNAAFRRIGLDPGRLTVVVAHATFCIVVVFNNVIARLRRLSPNLEEASADLGAAQFTTFRLVTFPLMKTALLAGALLAFALSFDEIVVTTFTAGAGIETLPQWIFNNFSRPNQVPVVNVVAVVVVALSIIPVYVAQRLTDSGPDLAGR